jgi:hypothetical protein
MQVHKRASEPTRQPEGFIGYKILNADNGAQIRECQALLRVEA